MATSKETRVLVEGFSKIMARTAPSRSFRPFGTRPLRLISRAQSMMARNVLASKASISRKCLVDMAVSRSNASGVSEGAALQRDASGIEIGASKVDLGLAHDERRQEADDIVAGLHGQHLLCAQRLEQLLVRHLAFQPEHQTLAAHLLDDVAVLVFQRGKPLLEPEPHASDVIEEAVLEHDVEHGIADRHSEGIAAEGRAV